MKTQKQILAPLDPMTSWKSQRSEQASLGACWWKFSFIIWGDGKLPDNSSNRCSHRLTSEETFLSSFSCSGNCRTLQELNPAWWSEHSKCSISKATLKYARRSDKLPKWSRSLWIRLCKQCQKKWTNFATVLKLRWEARCASVLTSQGLPSGCDAIQSKQRLTLEPWQLQ